MEMEAITAFDDEPSMQRNSGGGLCAYLLTGISIFFIILTFPISLPMCIKIVQEYERVVIFRLGRLVKGGARGPGLFFIIPCIDTYMKVDLRTMSHDVPEQEILTKDSVTVTVDAVVFYRIQNATIAVTNVENYSRSTHLLAATSLRNALGTRNLSEILSEREAIGHTMQTNLDDATSAWGVKVERVEMQVTALLYLMYSRNICKVTRKLVLFHARTYSTNISNRKDVRLPVQMQRVMAAEAEASREARAKVIAAEGEQRAARPLKEAADVISMSGPALQLRYLQTLTSIAAEKNSTIVFPLPLEFIKGFSIGAGQSKTLLHREDV
ncbi:stomatin-like [Ornithodoros turicata]|uniref:stomatin-like n=1 Tax=Ornithodoros turicata TaxID=34597 RepID=UPI0031393E91